MSRTDAGSTAITITLTEDDLDPYVTHASTRRWLTGPGLPGDSGLLTFEELRRAGLRTVADSLGDPDPLAEELRDQLVIGAPGDPTAARRSRSCWTARRARSRRRTSSTTART